MRLVPLSDAIKLLQRLAQMLNADGDVVYELDDMCKELESVSVTSDLYQEKYLQGVREARALEEKHQQIKNEDFLDWSGHLK